MCRWLFVLLLQLPFVARAQVNEFSFSYEAYLFGEQRGFADSVLNPGNAIFKVPDTTGVLDQRAELKWAINDAKIIFRPRIVSYKNDEKSDTDVNLTDAFYEQYITDRIFSTVGLQVYQWGPAEIMNPSNPFFHFNTNQRSLVYKEKGKALLRLNWNAKSDDSFVFIVEPVSNNETHWIAEEKFKPQFAAKFDTSWSGTRNFLGLAMGIPDNADFFIGEYFQYEFTEGFSIYADAKHSVNAFFYAPETQAGFLRMLPSPQDGVVSTLAVGGLRYEDTFDARLEYVYNSAGYDQKTFDNALIASSKLTPFLVENLTRFQLSGLELISQNYIYFSIRKTDPFDIKDLSLFFRSLTSLMDNSGVEQFEFDKSVLDWMNVFGQYSAYRGEQDSEFKLIDDWKASFGIKAIY
ncbi:hypothetical protein CIK05_03595 [Bdellovibrio sp. qaytius]|nr:hypothetical protein CIK05_03595 [Bdellovibrio sp. qaytius]